VSRRDQTIAATIAAAFALLIVGGFLVPASWQPLHGWLVTFFAWPDGTIWSNMLAWVLCGGIAFFGTHKVLARHQRETQKRLDHIIEHHPDIPPLPRGSKRK
jgi:hypothetical protein